MLVMSAQKLIALRDPHGFRPLALGRVDDTYVFASETCALDSCNAEFVKDINPGEMVVVDPQGIRYIDAKTDLNKSLCIFEYIYFARPDAVIDGVGVYASRIKAGRFLAMDSPVEADMVVGVPESGNPAAQGYAMESGIPYGTAFIKNSYVGNSDKVQNLLKEHKSTELVSGISLAELIKRPELNYDVLKEIDTGRPELSEEICNEVNIILKYEGYIARQQKQVEQFHKLEKKKIPANIDYDKVGSLRLEAIQKLKGIKPESIGQASRISGVSPSDISVLLVYLEQFK